ncbi:MAG: hypothetical protein KGJ02_07640 [Verrucomicrobiota bacterium]|nr:hypothetical protein [Verrucomicrobiota bacterium]
MTSSTGNIPTAFDYGIPPEINLQNAGTQTNEMIQLHSCSVPLSNLLVAQVNWFFQEQQFTLSFYYPSAEVHIQYTPECNTSLSDWKQRVQPILQQKGFIQVKTKEVSMVEETPFQPAMINANSLSKVDILFREYHGINRWFHAPKSERLGIALEFGLKKYNFHYPTNNSQIDEDFKRLDEALRNRNPL